MAYDPGHAEQMSDALVGTSGITEKKMFGGVGFTIHGNMAFDSLPEKPPDWRANKN